MIKYVFNTMSGRRLFSLSWGILMLLLDSNRVKEITDKIRNGNLSYPKKYKLKRHLPSIHWHINTEAIRRKGMKGTLSRLIVLDIDHMEGDVRQFYEQVIVPRLDELKVVFVQRSVSGDGVHVGFEMNPMFQTIAGNQFWMAKQLGLNNFDYVCCDKNRCMFVTPREDWFYINEPVMKQLLRDGSLKME